MKKVSELTDKELGEMLSKHEKIVQALIKEKEKRTGVKIKPKEIEQAVEARKEEIYSVVIDEELIPKNDVPETASGSTKEKTQEQDETDNMRLTRVLKLSKEELEQFNSAAEKKQKKK